ncbi:MAG TPA: hypothetical protein VLG14_10450 [Sphingomonas sp.]|nr:hypothetical protein [Sphingomonas sp.]
MKVFGVGCLYFGYLEGKSPSTRDDFLRDIKARLENVENVSSVTINTIYDEEHLPRALINKEGAEIEVPLAHGARLEFDIFLPFRIQESFYTKCDVETIHVDVIWEYDMPLAFVSYEWPDEEGDAAPSGLVVVLRKYLEKKLSTGNFKSGCIGPSPFHANFAIIETELNDGFKIDDVSADRLGYASMEIIAPRNSSVLQSVEAVRLNDALSKFYQLSELRSRAIREQTSIVANSRALLEQENPSTIQDKIKRIRRRPAEIDILNQNVFHEMLIRLDMSSALSEAERYQLISKNNPLSRFFERYREMSIEQSWGKFSDVAKFFEERHQKAIGNVTAILAGIIGGIVGSLIGSLATYALTSNSTIQPPPTAQK